MPSNILNPNKFANEIKKLSKYGLKIEILNENKLKKLGMNALLGVGQGSSNKSYVGIMRWQGGKKNQKPLAFVGKGVCFDTGGISLKPARFMEEMSVVIKSQFPLLSLYEEHELFYYIFLQFLRFFLLMRLHTLHFSKLDECEHLLA